MTRPGLWLALGAFIDQIRATTTIDKKGAGARSNWQALRSDYDAASGFHSGAIEGGFQVATLLKAPIAEMTAFVSKQMADLESKRGDLLLRALKMFAQYYERPKAVGRPLGSKVDFFGDLKLAQAALEIRHAGGARTDRMAARLALKRASPRPPGASDDAIVKRIIRTINDHRSALEVLIDKQG